MADEIQLHGARELRAALLRMDADARGPVLRRAVYQGGIRVRDRARTLAPRRTGKLARSIQVSRRRTNPLVGRVRVYARAPYAHLVEEGHRLVRGKKGGAQRVVGHVPAHPFLRSAFDATAEQAAQTIMAELWEGIERAWNQT